MSLTTPEVPEVPAAEELVAAADGENDCAALYRRRDPGPFRGEIGRDQRLLAILASTDVVEVVLAGANGVTDRDRRHVELVAPQPRPPREDGDVAAVGVDVEVLGVQMPDTNPHVRSQ